jgi:hypothetical protein
LADIRFEKGSLHGGFWRGSRTESNVDAEAGTTGPSQESGQAGAAEETAEWTFDTGRFAWTSSKPPACYANIPEPTRPEFPANAIGPK